MRRISDASRAATIPINHLRHELRAGRVVLLDLPQLNHPAIFDLQNCLLRDFEDIPSDADLGGFTVEEFQRYWAALGRWSICAAQLYLHAFRDGLRPEECVPTQCEPKDRFIDGIGELAGLSADKARAITDRLKWGPSIRRPDIMLQPLIVGPSTVTWSPRLIKSSKYDNSMLRVMSKLGGETERIAANLVGRREGPAAARLGEFIAGKPRSRWRYKPGQKIKCGGIEGDIDLLAWTPDCPEELLLIEYKACLEPGETLEIVDATEQTKKGQKQLQRWTQVLGRLSNDDKRALFPFVPWERIGSIYGIVVTSGGNPIHTFDHSEYPAITREAFLTRLRARDFLRPSRLRAACRDRDWLQVLAGADFRDMEIQVGELTYILPGFCYAIDKKKAPTRKGDGLEKGT